MLQLGPGHETMVIGCGFGRSLEHFEAFGGIRRVVEHA